MELRDECSVFGRGNSLLQHRQDLGNVAPQQSGRVEPKARKDLAL